MYFSIHFLSIQSDPNIRLQSETDTEVIPPFKCTPEKFKELLKAEHEYVVYWILLKIENILREL